MIILPAVVLILALALAVTFEVAHARVEKYWQTPLEKDLWGIVYWILVFVVLICCRIITLKPEVIFKWLPFIVVCLLHLFLCSWGGSFERWNTPSPTGGTGATPTPNAPNEPENRDIRTVRDPNDDQSQPYN